MKIKMKTVFIKMAEVLCVIAMAVGTVSVTGCGGIWYQEVEPEGFSKFAKGIIMGGTSVEKKNC